MHRGILLSFYSSAAAFVNGKCACFLPGFLGRAQKARAGQDDLECAPRALCAYSAEELFLFRVCRALRSAPNAFSREGSQR